MDDLGVFPALQVRSARGGDLMPFQSSNLFFCVSSVVCFFFYHPKAKQSMVGIVYLLHLPKKRIPKMAYINIIKYIYLTWMIMRNDPKILSQIGSSGSKDLGTQHVLDPTLVPRMLGILNPWHQRPSISHSAMQRTMK